jgi:hypothetical protein
MEEQVAPEPKLTPRVRSQRFRAGGVIVLAVAVGLALWLTLRENSGTSTQTTASAASQAQIRNLAATVNHPIFWVGPRAGFTYELDRLPKGTINIRYLPSGVKVGSSTPYLSVATYPFVNAYAALKRIKSKDVVFLNIPNRGIAEYSKKYPQSIHAAYPGVDYQIEVYDPSPGAANALVVSGQLAWLGKLKAGSGTTPANPSGSSAPKPTSASAAQLASLAASLGHSIYWVGPKARYTYEVTQTSSGKVYIRYLPPGVPVGSKKPYLSIATYPFPGAFKAIKRLATGPNVERITVPVGGVGLIGKSYPQSIHLAYPGSDFQIEVYDPSAGRVRSIVSSGQVRAIG